ncbi:MAG: L,D-transpeptidase [Enterobacteriaceae bacterium]|jgi:murein L,D-transpeptidase YcbB/YkuD|nr:L,D-transpeptidase [Enterobacteriaceae bacterium]
MLWVTEKMQQSVTMKYALVTLAIFPTLAYSADLVGVANTSEGSTPIEAISAQSKPIETKSVETKSIETKSITNKPVIEQIVPREQAKIQPQSHSQEKSQPLSQTQSQSESQGSVTVNTAREELLKALPSGVQLVFLSELSVIYSASNMQKQWVDKVAQQQFQQQLAEIALAGINPQFGQWAKLLSEPQVTDLARDAILSDALLGYLNFVNGVDANGTRWLYQADTYKISAPTAVSIRQWQQAVHSDDIAAFVHTLAPQNPQYAKMHTALKSLVKDSELEKSWPQIQATKRSLRAGDISENIPVLREILIRSGVLDANAKAADVTKTDAAKTDTTNNTDAVNTEAKAEVKTEVKTDANTPVATTSESTVPTVVATDATNPAAATEVVVLPEWIYSDNLAEAVERFQQLYGLEADGVIGSNTREALNMAPSLRAAVLALNIQRLRLLPATLDHGIFVNIPDYSLAYYVDGELILESKVIVGSVKRKTPLMNSDLNNVVVNPPWNVPVKLIREDLVPKAKMDANYLKKQGYTVYSGWGKDAEVVDPGSIDWSEGENYRLQQAPGRGNALGRFKFNMPNNDAIYLHDTSNHGLFNRTMRALSSGCIRINKAAQLANMLLNESGWSNSKIEETLKRGNTSYAPIRKKIPVQLYYMTSWVGADGNPKFRSDIYGYDNSARKGIKELPQVEKLLH